MWSFERAGDGVYVAYPADNASRTRFTNVVHEELINEGRDVWQGVGDGAGLLVRTWWRLTDGDAVVRVDVQVRNEGSSFVEHMRVYLPKIIPDSAWAASWRQYRAEQYGVWHSWPTDGAFQERANGNSFPASVAPICEFYDSASGKGCGVLAWDDSLREVNVFNRSFADRVEPHVLWGVRLKPGESAWLYCELRIYPEGNPPQFRRDGIPADHWRYFRQTFLKPAMLSRGIPEADQTSRRGVWGLAHSGDPLAEVSAMLAAYPVKLVNTWFNGNWKYGFYPPRPNLMMIHATDVDVRNQPPYPNLFDKMDDAAALVPYGYTVDLIVRSDLHNVPSADEAYISLTDPVYREQNDQERASMRARGITVAFWDLGFEAARKQGPAFISELLRWRNDGIDLFPEGASVALWVTGMTEAFPYLTTEFGNTYDSAMAQVIYPLSAPAAHNQADEDTWTDHAFANGVTPILDLTQIQDLAAG